MTVFDPDTPSELAARQESAKTEEKERRATISRLRPGNAALDPMQNGVGYDLPKVLPPEEMPYPAGRRGLWEPLWFPGTGDFPSYPPRNVFF